MSDDHAGFVLVQWLYCDFLIMSQVQLHADEDVAEVRSCSD